MGATDSNWEILVFELSFYSVCFSQFLVQKLFYLEQIVNLELLLCLLFALASHLKQPLLLE